MPLLGRTAVECRRDDLGRAIGSDVAALAREAGGGAPFVIDPLYWILHGLAGASGVGFELDPVVFRLTRANVEAPRFHGVLLATRNWKPEETR